MKNIITYYALAATLAASAAAHQHGHGHHHRRQHGTKVQKRSPAVVTEYVVAATETIYELAGEKLENHKAEAGLDGGNLVVVGESVPTYQPPPHAKTEATFGAQFIESEITPEPTVIAQPKPTTVVAEVPSAPAPVETKPKPAKSGGHKSGGHKSGGSKFGSSGSSSGSGVDRKFPSGEVPCSEFPSEFGAVALDWLEMDGWSGIQFVPGYSSGSSSISEIHTGISGDSCTKGAMCSYACPAGYQKTQWPKAQGSTKESIGGLYCNSQGFLELTRGEFDTLCDPGVGGVSIQNDLDESVATCRTDYPGTESMVIPAIAEAGSSVAICNPNQNKYYIWDGSGTSAQYYINKKGYATEDACVWNSAKDPEGAGNWSPLILGVGQAADGITYISIFQNLPTSTAKLDFNVEIQGDVNSKCSYINGQWTGGASGCTTGLRAGGKAIVRYF